jgi:hypothetical protein
MKTLKSVSNTTSEHHFPVPRVKAMVLKGKVKILQALKGSAPRGNREMIQHIINLYEGKKIPNFKTAENVVLRLSNTAKYRGIQEKTLKDCKAIAGKYADALPTTGRLARQIAEKQRKVGTRIASIALILFRRANTGDAEATVNAQGIGGPSAKQNVRDMGKKIQKEIANQSAKRRRTYGDLEHLYTGSFDRRLDADEVKFLKSIEKKVAQRRDHGKPRGYSFRPPHKLDEVKERHAFPPDGKHGQQLPRSYVCHEPFQVRRVEDNYYLIQNIYIYIYI